MSLSNISQNIHSQKTTNALSRQGFGMVVGLVVQYSLGMAINLFVKFPQNQGPGAEWHFATRNLLIMSHLILGTLLLVNAVMILVRSVKAKSDAWRLPARWGLFSLIFAWAAGDSFVTTQVNLLSYAMSIGFLLGLFSYGFGIYRSKIIVAT